MTSRRQRVAYYRAHFLESLRDDGVICLECGALRKMLGTHVLRLHHMRLDDYRERWGFNRQTRFVAPDTAERLRRLALTRELGAYGSRENLAKARAAKRLQDLPRRRQARLQISESKKALYASGWQPRRYRKVGDRTLRRLTRKAVDTKRVARETGLSIDQTRRRLQALALLPPHRPRRRIDHQRILALRRQGLWPLEIARRLRIQPSRPRPIRQRRVADNEFLAAIRRGGSTARIAERLGVSRAYVIYKTWYLRRHGLIAPVLRRGKPQPGQRPETRPGHRSG